jgi:hypothetical protein
MAVITLQRYIAFDGTTQRGLKPYKTFLNAITEAILFL